MIDAARRAAESLLTDTFTAYSPNGFTTVGNLEVQQYTNEGSTPGKTQGGSASTADTATEYVTVGGVRRPIMRGGLHIRSVPRCRPLVTRASAGSTHARRSGRGPIRRWLVGAISW